MTSSLLNNKNIAIVSLMSQVDQDAVPCDQSLVYSLHCLLRKRHHQAHTLQAPRPITAYPSQGRSKRLCLAGPSALTAAEVADDLQGCVVQTVLFTTCTVGDLWLQLCWSWLLLCDLVSSKMHSIRCMPL